jgi:hypothetical protein
VRRRAITGKEDGRRSLESGLNAPRRGHSKE